MTDHCVFHPGVEAAGLLLLSLYKTTVPICQSCMNLISPLANVNASDPTQFERDLEAIVHVAWSMRMSHKHSVTSCPYPCRAMCRYKREVRDLQRDGILPDD
jgi:hypothetical protein